MMGEILLIAYIASVVGFGFAWGRYGEEPEQPGDMWAIIFAGFLPGINLMIASVLVGHGLRPVPPAHDDNTP
jgi:hypothetical protein